MNKIDVKFNMDILIIMKIWTKKKAWIKANCVANWRAEEWINSKENEYDSWT